MDRRNVIKDIYTSDVVLMDLETEMMEEVDDTYFDMMEDMLKKVENGLVVLSEDELHLLEDKINTFYFDYGFVQFKRGLELGLSMRNIH